MQETTVTVHLKDLWDDKKANDLSGNQLSLLRYRSNLLGADLRITNFFTTNGHRGARIVEGAIICIL